MTKTYTTIIAALLTIVAPDATYTVAFAKEYLQGKTWEFDRNSDAIGQYSAVETGKIRITLTPDVDTMAFPEDANREQQYVMNIEDARHFWRFIKRTEPHFWFALDMAHQGRKHGFDDELVELMVNCAGCAENVEAV